VRSTLRHLRGCTYKRLTNLQPPSLGHVVSAGRRGGHGRAARAEERLGEALLLWERSAEHVAVAPPPLWPLHLAHRLPERGGTNICFTEGPQLPRAFPYFAPSAPVSPQLAVVSHMLPYVVTSCPHGEPLHLGDDPVCPDLGLKAVSWCPLFAPSRSERRGELGAEAPAAQRLLLSLRGTIVLFFGSPTPRTRTCEGPENVDLRPGSPPKADRRRHLP